MFEPLALPEETDEGYWVVTVQSEEYLQLHDNGGLYEGIDCDGASAYFDSERDAFHMSFQYYNSYEEVYPYFAEYCKAVDNSDANLTVISTIESEVMEFA